MKRYKLCIVHQMEGPSVKEYRGIPCVAVIAEASFMRKIDQNSEPYPYGDLDIKDMRKPDYSTRPISKRLFDN